MQADGQCWGDEAEGDVDQFRRACEGLLGNPTHCIGDGHYYSCVDERCNLDRSCSSDLGLQSCGCPDGLVPGGIFVEEPHWACQVYCPGRYTESSKSRGGAGPYKNEQRSRLQADGQCWGDDAHGTKDEFEQECGALRPGDAQRCDADGLWYSCEDERCNLGRSCSSSPGPYSCACPANVILAGHFEDVMGIAGAQRCDADGLWYSCGDERCNLGRSCSSSPGMFSCACPPEVTWAWKCQVVPSLIPPTPVVVEEGTTAEVSIKFTLPADVTDVQVVQAAKAAAASALEAAPDAVIVTTIVSKATGTVNTPPSATGKEDEVLAGIKTIVCDGQDNCVVEWVPTGRRLGSDRRLAEQIYGVTQTVTVSPSPSLSSSLPAALSRPPLQKGRNSAAFVLTRIAASLRRNRTGNGRRRSSAGRDPYRDEGIAQHGPQVY